MELTTSELRKFNHRAAKNTALLEGFQIGTYHIMPRVVHLSTSRGNRFSRSHTHKIWEFNLIIEGEMNFFWNDQSAKLTPGDIFFMPPESPHGWQMLSSNFLILGFQTSMSFISGNNKKEKKQLMAAMDKLKHCFHNSPSILEKTKDLIHVLINTPPFYREKSHILLRSIYLDIFSRLFPEGIGPKTELLIDDYNLGGAGKKVSEILEYYISDNIGKPIKVEDVCKQFNLSECQLNRLCKRETGKTISGYISHRKMSFAMNFLKSSSRMIKEIAVLTGYPNVNYFCRRFKQVTGMSPEEFRSKNR